MSWMILKKSWLSRTSLRQQGSHEFCKNPGFPVPGCLYREAKFFWKILASLYQVAGTGKPRFFWKSWLPCTRLLVQGSQDFFENPVFPVPGCWYREARNFSKFLDLSYQVASTGKPGFLWKSWLPRTRLLVRGSQHLSRKRGKKVWPRLNYDWILFKAHLICCLYKFVTPICSPG